MSTATALMTAEEYAQMPELGQPSELVRGKLIVMNLPYPRHGEICATTAIILGPFVKKNRLGRIIANDSGVITERDPDTVRGPDVAYVSYARLPSERLPAKYLDSAPEIAFEVLSDSDRWSDVLAKVAEYLNAGVIEVCVLDPELETAQIFAQDKPSRTLTSNQELSFPEILPGFSVRVSEFFE